MIDELVALYENQDNNNESAFKQERRLDWLELNVNREYAQLAAGHPTLPPTPDGFGGNLYGRGPIGPPM